MIMPKLLTAACGQWMSKQRSKYILSQGSSSSSSSSSSR